ncbi:diguanylate cyclase [Candidatus Solincola tengchongensis]|uniref:GGDEF domain-containing response regulator n=1 Tax=Candidatus Solincola tengchongensis TaxID=2900693 RepID=UPI0025806902|nr:diguanylate cyclase [Candidatus Solincola tengchongensis]
MEDGKHLLLADDNKLVVKVTGSILEKAGYRVDVAWDGIEAAMKAFSLLPDLMILDIEMPKIKGYQVCRLLKEDPMTSWMPIIMLTGREHQTDMFWGLKTGADAYITKGFKPEHLLQEVETLLSASEKNREARDLARRRRKEVSEDYVINKITDLLDRKLFETTILNDIASLAGSMQDFTETVSSIFQILDKLFNYYVGALLLFEERELYLYLNRPVTPETLENVISQTMGTATGYAWQPGDEQSVGRTVLQEDNLVTTAQEKPAGDSYIHIPLIAHQMPIGLLLLAGPSTPAFRRDAPSILNLVSNQLVMIVDNSRLYEGAKRMAITDGLTRIYNHRFFQELFEKEYKRSLRYNTVFSFIMLDIDFFKRINDTYGHLFGDEILKETASLIKGCLRSMDILARYGGEEFAILLPETDLESAVQTAERIRMAVENHDFTAPGGKPVRVTVSQGVTSFPSPGVQDRSDIVAKADAALYEAKESGRNLVRFRE